MLSANLATLSTRSLGMVTPNWMTTDFIIKEPVLGGASIAAVNEQGRDNRGIEWETPLLKYISSTLKTYQTKKFGRKKCCC